MDKDIGAKLFSWLTEAYDDKLDEKKDLKDYLNEKTKDELASIYIKYLAAGSALLSYDANELYNKNKKELIDLVMDFLDSQIIVILQFMNDKRMEQIKTIANKDSFLILEPNENNEVSLDIIMKLKSLGFIFCQKDGDKIRVHMPKFIKDKIKKLNTNFYLDYYDDLITYVSGMILTYGAIKADKAYILLDDTIPIGYTKFFSILLFTSMLEIEAINVDIGKMAIYDVDLKEKDINKFLRLDDKIMIYKPSFYKKMSDGSFMKSLKEYKSFRNYLKNNFEFDLNDDDFLREELIQDYFCMFQIDEKRAKEILNSSIDTNFDIDDEYKKDIINYINQIKDKMPVWKEGGKLPT